MTKRLFDYDPLTRTTTYHHYDHQTGRTWLESIQDVEPYLERNKRLALTPEYASRGKKMDMFHFATVPNQILYKWLKEDGLDWTNKDHLPRIERKLMSNEFKYLRTADRI